MGDLSTNFNRKEFDCNDGCGKNNISMELVQKLDQLRNDSGLPIIIRSGCRCDKHNAEVGGVDSSSHIDGLASDIVALDSRSRFQLLRSIFKLQLFHRIGIGKTFIHVDIDFSKPPVVIWLY